MEFIMCISGVVFLFTYSNQLGLAEYIYGEGERQADRIGLRHRGTNIWELEKMQSELLFSIFLPLITQNYSF